MIARPSQAPSMPFAPPGDYSTGIRGGPLLPGSVSAKLTPSLADDVVSGPRGRYILAYSETAPTGQRLAIGIATLGLAEQVHIISAERGHLICTSSGSFDWTTPEPEHTQLWHRNTVGVRLPALIGPSGLVSNDPYLTLFELARASTRIGRLYPPSHYVEQKRWTTRVFYDLHAAVYRAGCLSSQVEYQREVDRVEQFFSDVDEHLSNSPYLTGDHITDADIWLFCLLIRFDQVYSPAFRLHRYRIRDFASIHRYSRDLYGRELFSMTTNFSAISTGYYRGIPFLDRGVTPIGPDDLFLR
ncbi:glutathione S-transferase C-terminal domain-containing protein [Microbacterium lacticum]